VLIVLAIIGLIVARQGLYIVDETERVIVLRFGEVQAQIESPGLKLKAPFVDQVVRLDKRLLRIDAPSTAMPDREKQNLVIDSYARYRIIDSVQFFQTLQNDTTAFNRLGTIVNSTLRDRIALRDRSQIIGAEPILDPTGAPVVDDEGLPIVEASETRSELLSEVLALVKQRVANENFGVEIIDVRIKRADFPESVTPSIYDRMRAERNRIATRFRAQGEEEDLKIRAVANRDREIILAQADRESNQIRGEGEAEAIRILAAALNVDPDFFAFRRSLEAYQAMLSQQDTIVFSADTPLFRFLDSPGVTILPEEAPGSEEAPGPAEEPAESPPVPQS
jgi:membrane protease subunit HflC